VQVALLLLAHGGQTGLPPATSVGAPVNTERNKNTIRRFFDAFVNGRNDEMYAFLTDDATWWVNGKTAFSSTIEKSVWFELIKSVFAKAALPLGFEILSITAEDDRVSVEVASHVSFEKIGLNYENEYHFLFRLRNDQICSVREYLDTEYVAKMMPLLVQTA
jgi:uncharacterized protein